MTKCIKPIMKKIKKLKMSTFELKISEPHFDTCELKRQDAGYFQVMPA